MPYFIYRIRPPGILEPLHSHESFSQASAQAKQLRGELPPNSLERIKVIFAENHAQAEDLLTQVREPPPPGEE